MSKISNTTLEKKPSSILNKVEIKMYKHRDEDSPTPCTIRLWSGNKLIHTERLEDVPNRLKFLADLFLFVRHD